MVACILDQPDLSTLSHLPIKQSNTTNTFYFTNNYSYYTNYKLQLITN